MQCGAGLIVRPTPRTLRGIDFCFECANIRCRGIARGGQFRRIKLGDQVSLVNFGALVHREMNHAPRNLRAHDHVVAADDAGEQNVAAARCRR